MTLTNEVLSSVTKRLSERVTHALFEAIKPGDLYTYSSVKNPDFDPLQDESDTNPRRLFPDIECISISVSPNYSTLNFKFAIAEDDSELPAHFVTIEMPVMVTEVQGLSD